MLSRRGFLKFTGLVASGLVVGINPFKSQPTVFDTSRRFKMSKDTGLLEGFPIGILQTSGFWKHSILLSNTDQV
jgi:hypothetical protein